MFQSFAGSRLWVGGTDKVKVSVDHLVSLDDMTTWTTPPGLVRCGIFAQMWCSTCDQVVSPKSALPVVHDTALFVQRTQIMVDTKLQAIMELSMVASKRFPQKDPMNKNESTTNANTGIRAMCSWSGGKDSCYSMMLAQKKGFEIQVIFNVMNENGEISRSHGIPKHILQQQADALGVPLVTVCSTWDDYESTYIASLQEMQQRFQLTHAIFGDIDIDRHRQWEEKVCAAAHVMAELPIWQRNRRELVLEMLTGPFPIETMIVSCNDHLGERFLGKIITEQLVEELDHEGVDVCGENGEFHTLVINCPAFAHRIDVQVKQKVKHGEYWFCILE